MLSHPKKEKNPTENSGIKKVACSEAVFGVITIDYI